MYQAVDGKLRRIHLVVLGMRAGEEVAAGNLWAEAGESLGLRQVPISGGRQIQP